MGSIANYNFGGKGVNLVKNPLHLDDAEASQLQNAEFRPDEATGGRGALTMRGGLAALNGSAMTGSVLGMFGWPLKTTFTRTIYAARHTEDANTFRTSSAGTSWADTSSPAAAAAQAKFADENNSRDARRMVTYKQYLVYAGNVYTQDTDNPVLVIWDGATAQTIVTIPPGPSGNGSPPFAITDLLAANGKVYVAVHDPGGTGPDNAGRVLELDVETGVLRQVATGFGGGTGEMTGGAPACLAWYQNQIWVGLNGETTTNGIGKIVRAYPDSDLSKTWTSDVATLVSHVSSLCVFKGDLYAGTQSSATTGARISKRTASTAAWTTIVTSGGGAGGSGHYAHMVVDGDTAAYCVEYFSGGTDIIHILRTTDGTTWSTDRDVDADDGPDTTNPQLPGGSLIYNSVVYFTFRSLSASSTDGFIMRRASGVWTKIDTDNILGPIGVLVERS